MNYFELLDRLHRLYIKSYGQELTSRQIVTKLKRAIPFTDLKILKIDSISSLKNQIDVSGLYDPEMDYDNEPCIFLEIVFPARLFKFDESDLTFEHWHHFVIDIVSVLGHEFVHLHQSRKRHFNDGRNYKSNAKNIIFRENQEYYGIPDEIDAYGFTAATAMINQKFFYNEKPVLEKTSVYNIYRHFFGKNDKVTQLLIKKTKKHYRKLERQYNDTYCKKRRNN